ncbi:MAG: zinc ribbon domain-containing protein [Candidatus Dormiibacterota bacterium]
MTIMQGRRLAAWAMAGTVLAVASLLFFVDLFLPWAEVCGNTILFHPYLPGNQGFSSAIAHATSASCASSGNGFGGAGIVAAVLAGVLFLWETTRVARIPLPIGLGHRSLISAGLAFGVVLFAAVDVLARLTWESPAVGGLIYGGLFIWIAVALAVLIGLAGVVHWRLWEERAPAWDSPAGPMSASQAVTSPPQSTPPPSAAGVCPYCGAINPSEAKFCSNCGRSLAPPPPSPRSPRRPRSTS